MDFPMNWGKLFTSIYYKTLDFPWIFQWRKVHTPPKGPSSAPKAAEWAMCLEIWGRLVDWDGLPQFMVIFWLVLWNFCFPYNYWEFHNPNWLIFFRGVGIPPTRWSFADESWRIKPATSHGVTGVNPSLRVEFNYQKWSGEAQQKMPGR